MAVNNPVLLSATSGNNSINVTWDNNNPYLSSVQSAYLLVTANVAVDGAMGQIILTGDQWLDLSYNITGLTNGVEYSITYFIEVDDVNLGSEPLSAIPAGPPSPPYLTLVSPTNKGVNLHVDLGASNGAGVLKVVFLICKLLPPPRGGIIIPPVSRPVDPSGNYSLALENFVDYQISCVAGSIAGQSEISNSIYVTPTDKPNVPVITAAQSGGNTQSNLAWLPGTQLPETVISSYKIYVYPCSLDASDNLVPSVNASQIITFQAPPVFSDASLNTVITGLTNGLAYSVQISAIDTNTGEGDKSNPAIILPYISPVMNNLALGVENLALLATWSDATITSFYSFVTPVTYKVGANSATYTTEDLSYNITGLTNGTPYLVSLYGTYQIPNKLYLPLFNKNGQTVAGSPVYQTGIPAAGPDVPTGLSATVELTTVQLEWDAPYDQGSPITKYTVYQYSDASTNFLMASYDCLYTIFVVGGLTTGTPYYFNVSASNVNGESLKSSSIGATPIGNIKVPTNVSLVQNGTDMGYPELQLTWTSQNDNIYTASTYNICQYNISTGIKTNQFDVSANAFDSSFNQAGITQYNYTTNITLSSTASQIYYYLIQTQRNSPLAQSEFVLVSVTVGSLPVVSGIYIDVSSNTINFTVDAKGVALSSLLVLCPPVFEVANPTPFYSVTPNASTGISSYSVQFYYPLTTVGNGQTYLIFATNALGCGYKDNISPN